MNKRLSPSLPHRCRGFANRSSGFSLIELIVGMGIGLLCTLVIATVLSAAEGQRRGTTTGSDAQVAGSVALYTVQRDVAMAGYGFSAEPNAVGCQLQARFNGVQPAALPPRLAPVLITQGTSDTVRVLASSKFIDPATNSRVGYTVPARVTPKLYDPNDPDKTKLSFTVASTLSISSGDLMVVVVDDTQPCQLFQVTSQPTDGVTIPRATDAARWNPTGWPSLATREAVAKTDTTPAFPGSAIVNLGRLVDVAYSVDADQRLVASTLDTATLARTTRVLQGNVVLLKAMYGRDTNADGAVDTYDYTAPTTNAGWLSVLSIRMAVVARSAQYEKEEVTKVNPSWDVGTATSVTGAATCGSSKCIELKVDGLSDWTHYRYKVFDTVVPLRNQLWKSDPFVETDPSS